MGLPPGFNTTDMTRLRLMPPPGILKNRRFAVATIGLPECACIF
jgi:hypothetical protein